MGNRWAAGKCHCCCSGFLNIRVVAGCCNGSPMTPLVGVVVTVTQGATTIGTCTTDSTGNCSVAIAAAGTYTVQTNAGANLVQTVTVVVPVCRNGRIGKSICVYYPLLTIKGTGCTSCTVDSTVTLKLSGTTVYSGTARTHSVPILPSTAYTYTASAARFTGLVGSVGATISCNPALNLTFNSPLVGYSCGSFDDGYPMADTMFLTDSLYGAITLTRSSSTRFVSAVLPTSPLPNSTVTSYFMDIACQPNVWAIRVGLRNDVLGCGFSLILNGTLSTGPPSSGTITGTASGTHPASPLLCQTNQVAFQAWTATISE